MAHFIFLFNLLTLFAGLVWAGVLFRRWRAGRRPLEFWRFLHFLGFTFTMVVAALDAYAVVNLGVGAGLIRPWSAAVLVGSALMLFSFPHLARAEAARPRPWRFSLFWAGCTALPLVAAFLLFVIDDFTWLLGIIAVGFLPFWGSIVYSLGTGGRPEGPPRWQGWVTFAVLLSVGVGEVWWVVTAPPQDGYFFITLPLAYLYTVVTSGTQSPAAVTPAPGPRLELSAEISARMGLSPRELQVAQGILRGLSNKELAWELGLAENTVRNHIFNLYRKLGIQKRLDLVLLVQKYQAG